jgi:hypothetical protein
MKNYWSCTKFADWIRGTIKPRFGTEKCWNNWEKMAKTKKYRYWLAEEGLDHLQNFIFWPANLLNSLRCYINNRWIIKSHTLTSTLKRGQWHDLDVRLLHSIFDELVNFVEIELAWMNVVFDQDDKKKYKTPWYRTFFKIRLWRNSETGIEYLNWASELKYDDESIEKNDPNFGRPTPQALAAQEIHKLYTWWKEKRPNRPDPSDASGWSKYCEEKLSKAKAEDHNQSLSNMRNNSNNTQARNLLDILHKIEQEQDNEDTEMLIRLIKIRHSLWT